MQSSQAVYNCLHDNTFVVTMIEKKQPNWDYMILLAVRLFRLSAISDMCYKWKSKTFALPMLLSEICDQVYAAIEDEELTGATLSFSQWRLLGLLTDIYGDLFAKYEHNWTAWMKRHVALPMGVFTRRVHENRCVWYTLSDIGLFA